MTTRNLTFSINEFYHLYSRGVDKRVIFLNDEDKKRFIRLLFLCNSTEPVSYKDVKNKKLSDLNVGEKLVALGAYCLMNNHFHILIKETIEGGTTKFMSKLLTAYASYFNKKYERTGALFGSEFKSNHANTDEYLKYLFSYIHLNPLKMLDSEWRERGLDRARAKDFLDGYKFSSHADFVGENREENLIINKTVFPAYFEKPEDFEDQIYDWLNYDTSRALPSGKGGLL